MVRRISQRTLRRGLADWWLFAALVVFTATAAGWSVWHSPNHVARQSATRPSEASHRVVDRPIETIRVGERVLTEATPGSEPDERYGDDVNPALWQKMLLLAPKRDGGTARVEMLRPRSWLEEHGVRARGQVEIDVPECGIQGRAEVLDVGPCPSIDTGPGRVVTATFHHEAVRTIDVSIDVLEKPIGCTANHPIWSETKQAFVRADQLQPGEHVRTLQGTARVTSVVDRGRTEPVFNIEVQRDHVYYVADAGLLVHNGGLTILNPCFTPSNVVRRDFGTAVHQEFPEHLAKNYPGTGFRKNVGPGQRGPDAEWLGNGPDPGFDIADLKPATESGLRRFEAQAGRWEGNRVGLFLYDPATGEISFGGVFQ